MYAVDITTFQASYDLVLFFYEGPIWAYHMIEVIPV